MKKINILLIFSLLFLTISATKAQNAVEAPLKVRINHIAVYVYDLEKSRDFYENILQLKRIPEPFKDGLHEWFSVGEPAQLHLIKGAKEITEHTKNGHICFSVATIDEFIANLKKHNINFESWKGEADKPTVRVDGVKQIYFKDPDGNWIEINDDHR